MSERVNSTKGFSVSEIAKTGVMAAMIFALAWVIKIPTPDGGFVQLADGLVLIAALVLRKRDAVIASVIGMTMIDIVTAPTWAPFTFIIKGLMAYLVFVIAFSGKNEGKNRNANIIAFILAEVVMIVGYFVAAMVLSGLFTGYATWQGAIAIGAEGLVGNVFQAITGVVLALVLSEVLIRKNMIYKK